MVFRGAVGHVQGLRFPSNWIEGGCRVSGRGQAIVVTVAA